MRFITMQKNSRFGFTLIELMVVIAIIGILAALAFPNFTRTREAATDARVKTAVKAYQSAMETKYNPVSGLYPTAAVASDFADNQLPGASVLAIGVNSSTAPTAYCVVSVQLNRIAEGNCSGQANGVCAFCAPGSDITCNRYCAKNLQ
jgi:prepilin-type N-terminal cleavage/methylation domain-containing protein